MYRKWYPGEPTMSEVQVCVLLYFFGGHPFLANTDCPLFRSYVCEVKLNNWEIHRPHREEIWIRIPEMWKYPFWSNKMGHIRSLQTKTSKVSHPLLLAHLSELKHWTISLKLCCKRHDRTCLTFSAKFNHMFGYSRVFHNTHNICNNANTGIRGFTTQKQKIQWEFNLGLWLNSDSKSNVKLEINQRSRFNTLWG